MINAINARLPPWSLHTNTAAPCSNDLYSSGVRTAEAVETELHTFFTTAQQHVQRGGQIVQGLEDLKIAYLNGLSSRIGLVNAGIAQRQGDQQRALMFEQEIAAQRRAVMAEQINALWKNAGPTHGYIS